MRAKLSLDGVKFEHVTMVSGSANTFFEIRIDDSFIEKLNFSKTSNN